MSSLYKRGGMWVLQWREDGKKIVKTTGVSVANDPAGKLAEQVQRDHDSAEAKQTAGVRDAPALIRECLDRWLAARKRTAPRYFENRSSAAKRICAWFEGRRVDTFDLVTPELVEEYIQDRLESVGPKTARGDLDMIRGAAKIANRTRTINPIPVDSWPVIERTTTRRPDTVGAYTADEVERIIDDLGKRPGAAAWRLPTLCLAYLGCRWSELERARVGDLRLDESPPMIRLENHKTGKAVSSQFRWVEVHPRLVSEFRSRVQILGRDLNSPLIEMPNQNQARKVMMRTCKRLGIQYRRTHGLRHFWISQMLSAGCPLPVVMAQSGHRNLSTVQGYLHLPDRHPGWISKAFPGK